MGEEGGELGGGYEGAVGGGAEGMRGKVKVRWGGRRLFGFLLEAAGGEGGWFCGEGCCGRG